jgi:hypothetical protein
MTFTAFGAAPSHSCGLSNGDVYCWGSNSSGALGIGSTDTQTHPDPVKASATVSFKALHVGTNRTCALTTAGELYCWGGGVVAPTPMAGGGSYENFAMAPSTMDVCAVTAAGSVDCWAGVTGSIRAVTSPVGLTQIGVGSPGVGFEHSYYPIFSCGISSSGDAYCWSENFVATKLGAQ